VTPLLSRILVAVPLIALAVYAAYAGGWLLVIGGAVAAMLALHEFYVMLHDLRPLIPAGMIGVVLVLVAIHKGGVAWAVLPLFAVLALAFWLSAVADVRQPASVQLAVTVFGVVWIGYGIGFLIAIRDIPQPADWGRDLLLAVFLGVWISDSAAYAVGRMLGRRPLAPVISPNKTVEGFVAGLVFGFAAVFFTVYHQPNAADPLSPLHAVELAAAVTLAAPLGDLFESYLKRDIGVKDTGKLLAGHGGVLDRVDALLFAGAAAYAVALAIGRA
jgi:phosphatidate cytidylyltransferase